MNLHEYRHLQAERNTLNRFLDALPEASVIERMSLEARKKKIEERMALWEPPERAPVRVRLMFRGKSVVGRHGIFADFGAEAVNAFSKAVAAMGAGQQSPLGTRGVLPNSEVYRLLITGTTPGSFGFELEKSSDSPDSLPVELAIAQTKSVLQATIGMDDDALADTISDIAPRALNNLRAFLAIMINNETACTLEFRDDVFRFLDVNQVRASHTRLAKDNIHEKEEDFSGRFVGILPNRRMFEFVVEDTGVLVAGKVGVEIEKIDEIRNVLNNIATIHVMETKVGMGRPRYVLRGYERIRE